VSRGPSSFAGQLQKMTKESQEMLISTARKKPI